MKLLADSWSSFAVLCVFIFYLAWLSEKGGFGLPLMDRNGSLQERVHVCSVAAVEGLKRSPAKVGVFEEECNRPFGVVHTDMKGLLLESHCGLRYFT